MYRCARRRAYQHGVAQGGRASWAPWRWTPDGTFPRVVVRVDGCDVSGVGRYHRSPALLRHQQWPATELRSSIDGQEEESYHCRSHKLNTSHLRSRSAVGVDLRVSGAGSRWFRWWKVAGGGEVHGERVACEDPWFWNVEWALRLYSHRSSSLIRKRIWCTEIG